MAQLHYDDKNVEPHCTAEVWPPDFKFALLLIGDLSATLNEEEFVNLHQEMGTVKEILGW